MDDDTVPNTDQLDNNSIIDLFTYNSHTEEAKLKQIYSSIGILIHNYNNMDNDTVSDPNKLDSKSIIDFLKSDNGIQENELKQIYTKIQDNSDILYKIIIDENINLEYQKELVKLLSAEEIATMKEKYNWDLQRIFDSLSLIIKDMKNFSYNKYMEMIFDNNYIPITYKTVLSRRINDIHLSELISHVNNYVMDGIDKEFLLKYIISTNKCTSISIIEALKIHTYFSEDEINNMVDMINDTPTNLCNMDLNLTANSALAVCSVDCLFSDQTKKKVLLKLLPFDIYKQYWSYFKKIKPELIIDVYLTDINNITLFLNSLQYSESNELSIQFIIKIYLKFMDQFNNEIFEQIAKIIIRSLGQRIDDEFIMGFILKHIDIDTKIQPAYTYLEYIIEKTHDPYDKIKTFIIQLFEKSKDLKIHTNININKLITLNLNVDMGFIKK